MEILVQTSCAVLNPQNIHENDFGIVMSSAWEACFPLNMRSRLKRPLIATTKVKASSTKY